MLRYLLFSVLLFVCFRSSIAVTPPGGDRDYASISSLQSLQPLQLARGAAGVGVGVGVDQDQDLLELEETMIHKKNKDRTAEAMVEGNVMAKDNDNFHDELQKMIDKESHSGKTLSVNDIQSLVGKEVVLSVKDVHAAVEQVRGDLIGQLKEGINELSKGTSFIKAHENIPQMKDKMKLLEDNIAELKEKVKVDQKEEPMMVPAKSSSINSGNVNQTVVVIVGNENATSVAATPGAAAAAAGGTSDTDDTDEGGDNNNNSGADGVKIKPAGVESKHQTADGGSLEESSETISNDDADDQRPKKHHHRHRHHVESD